MNPSPATPEQKISHATSGERMPPKLTGSAMAAAKRGIFAVPDVATEMASILKPPPKAFDALHDLATDLALRPASVLDTTGLQTALEAIGRELNVDEAVAYIHVVHLETQSIQDYQLKLKWWMGFVLVHTHRPYGQKCAIVEEIAGRLWTEHAIRACVSTLYECASLYENCDRDYAWFLNWIEERKRLFGRPVYWYDVQNELLGGRNNPDVIGREAADERDFRDAERAFEIVERIIQRAAEGSEEAAGVLVGMNQSLVGLRFLPDAKPMSPRDPNYLAFVRRFGCVVCHGRSEPHHALGRKGTGAKASDFGTVPLCRKHHDEIHAVSRRAFEHRHRISLAEVALNLIHRYLTGSWITLTLNQHDAAASEGID